MEQERGKIVLLFYDSGNDGRHVSITDAVTDRLAKAGYKVYKRVNLDEMAAKYQEGYVIPIRYDTRIAVFCLGFNCKKENISKVQEDVIRKIGNRSTFTNKYNISKEDILVVRVTNDYTGWIEKVHKNGMTTAVVRVDDNMHSAMAAAKIFDKLSHMI